MKVAFILTSHMGALKFIGEAMVDCDRAIDTFNDFTQTDFGRGAVEFIASGDALVGLGDTGLRELAEDLESETEGDSCQLGNILGALLAAGKCQTIGYANRVICLVCNSQLVPSFLSWNNYSIALFRTNVNRFLSK